MSRFGRSARMLVASALILSTATLFAASPASAAPTAFMQDNGDGTMTVTYDLTGGTPGQGVFVGFFSAGLPCTPGSGELFFTQAVVGGGVFGQLPASPAVLAEGSTVFFGNGGPGPIPAGTYTACLVNQGIQQQFQMTFGAVAPPTTRTTTTTTTTLPTTTTTTTAPGGVESTTTTVAGVAVGDPVTPAFTG